MRKFSLAAIIVVSLIILTGSTNLAHAVTVFSTGAGSAVSTVNRIATFDSINANGLSLLGYTEDSLIISVDDISFVGFDAFTDGVGSMFHYGNGGNTAFVTITPTDNVDFVGLEFKAGLGNSQDLFLTWETYRNNVLTGSGQEQVPRGTIVGFSDVLGFDELRVAAHLNSGDNFGDHQAIAIDDLKVQLFQSTVVVGGKIIPIESTSLLISSAQTFSWMIPVTLSILGIGLFVVSRKSE